MKRASALGQQWTRAWRALPNQPALEMALLADVRADGADDLRFEGLGTGNYIASVETFDANGVRAADETPFVIDGTGTQSVYLNLRVSGR